jgi:hypothetical protein
MNPITKIRITRAVLGCASTHESTVLKADEIICFNLSILIFMDK